MKKPQDWEKLLDELNDPTTDQKVDVGVLLSWLMDDRSKHYRTYTRNALAFCVSQFIDNPKITEQEKDFYRGAAMAYRSLMNLKSTLEKQVGGQEVTKKQAASTGTAGY